jgi:flagellar basal-body rod protein FlgB
MAQGGLTAKQKETTLSGNSVTLDHELMKSADTAMDYQLVTNLYRKQIGMFRAVLTRGG